LVNYATADRPAESYWKSATAGSDYQAASGTLKFLPGQTSKTISVVVNDDLLGEPYEAFDVIISDAINARIGNGSGLAVITDNEPRITLSDVTVTEGDNGTISAVFTAYLSKSVDASVTVDYSTMNLSAVAGLDYYATSGTITFAPGQTVQTVTVAVMGDAIDEYNENFSVKLTNASANAFMTWGDSPGVTYGYATILDDDEPSVSVSITSASVVEGNSGTQWLLFSVNLSASSVQSVSVSYMTLDDTAIAGSDYTAVAGTVSFAPGETSKTIAVAVVGDRSPEPTETLTVKLDGANNAFLANALGLGTILDDEPRISISDGGKLEGRGGKGSMVFTVSLSTAYDVPVTVYFATADGIAKAGEDYAATSGTLTFAPGETTKTIAVEVYGDRKKETNETLFLNLSSATNASVLDDLGIGTIFDDD
jgi:large repetitive protein